MFFSFVTKIFCQRKVSGDFRANRRRPKFPGSCYRNSSLLGSSAKKLEFYTVVCF